MSHQVALDPAALIAPLEGVPDAAHGWVYQQTEELDTILRHSLRSRRDFTRWELLQANKAYDLDNDEQSLDKQTSQQLLHRIIQFAFATEPDTQSKLKDLYAKPPPEQEQKEE